MHQANGTTDNADVLPAGGNLLATVSNVYPTATNLTSLHPASITNVGGSHTEELRGQTLTS